MKITKLEKPFEVNKECTCKRVIKMLPENHRFVTEDDLSNGLWFECEKCSTTLFMPSKKFPEVAKLAA